jgi:hypothetical protein
LEEGPEEEIGCGENKKTAKENIVKLMNHKIIAKVQISKSPPVGGQANVK